MRWCLLGLVLMSACSGGQPSLVSGEIAPAFALTDLEGNTFHSKEIAAKPTILNFWATWCGPCKDEIPDLEAIHASGQAQVIGIALDEEGAKKVRPFVKRSNIEYPILIDKKMKVFRQYNGLAVPHSVILDRDQRVVAVHVGRVSREDLEKDLAELSP